MTKYLLISLIFATATLTAQIPDSLLLTVPWDYIYVDDCSVELTDDPTSPRDDVFISSADVDELTDVDGNCTKLIRTWTILNWNDGATYEYQQIVKVDETVTLTTTPVVEIQKEDLPMTLLASDLVTNYDPTHTYSYSMQDATDTERVFTAADTGTGLYHIYDHSIASTSQTEVIVYTCEDDTEVIIPEEVDIEIVGTPYIFVDLDMLGVSVTYTCGDYWHDIAMGVQGSVVFASQVGGVTYAVVTLTFSNGTIIEQEIKINVVGDGIDPIPFFVEEKSFEAGETVELDIWTTSLDDLIALQFRLNVQDADIVDLVKGSEFDDIPFNIFNDAKTINLLWTPSDAQAMDVPADETWFTLVVEPTISGSTLDIFTTTIDPWSSIAIEDEQLILEYEPEFVFTIAPRDVLSSTVDPAVDDDVQLERQVVNQYIHVLADGRQIDAVTIYDATGIPVASAATEMISVAHLPSGTYFASILLGSERSTLQFVKI